VRKGPFYPSVLTKGQRSERAMMLALAEMYVVGVATRKVAALTVLGVSVALGEQEVHWRTFLQSLVQRGLRGVERIISDDHAGLRAKRQAICGGIPWQRCQFRPQQNAQAYVPRKAMPAKVAERVLEIFNASSQGTAEQLLKAFVEDYAEKAPQ